MDFNEIKDYVVFDEETNGFDPKEDDIIRLSALKVCGGKVIGKFNAYIKPRKESSPEVELLTGIKNAKLKKCKSIEEILPVFDVYVEKLPVVCKHPSFVNGFFEEYKELLVNYFSASVFDIRSIAKGLFPNENKISDKDLSLLFNVKGYKSLPELYYGCFEKAKQLVAAIGDARIVLTVQELKEILKETEINALALQKKFNWGYSDACVVIDYMGVCKLI